MKVIEKYLTMTIDEQTKEFKKHCKEDVNDCDCFDTCDECHIKHLNSEFVEQTPLEKWGSKLVDSYEGFNTYEQGCWEIIVSSNSYRINSEGLVNNMGGITKDLAKAIVEEMDYLSK